MVPSGDGNPHSIVGDLSALDAIAIVSWLLIMASLRFPFGETKGTPVAFRSG